MVTLLSFLGIVTVISISLIAGVLLKLISQGEVKQGKLFLNIAQYTSLSLIVIAFAAYYQSINIYFLTSAAILSIGGITLRIQGLRDWLNFLFLGALLALSVLSEQLIVIISSVIFIYGLITGSLLTLKKSWKKEIILCITAFCASSIALFLVFMV